MKCSYFSNQLQFRFSKPDTVSEFIDTAHRIQVAGILDVYKTYSNDVFALSLTGGKDSRLTILFRIAGINIQTFTFNKSLYSISLADICIPFIISFLFKSKHWLINKLHSVASSAVQDFDFVKGAILSPNYSASFEGGYLWYYQTGQYRLLYDRLKSPIVVDSIYYDVLTGRYLGPLKFRDNLKLMQENNCNSSQYYELLRVGKSLFPDLAESDYFRTGLTYWLFKRYYHNIGLIAFEASGLKDFSAWQLSISIVCCL